MVERLFLEVPRGCLQFVIVVFPDHTDLLFFTVDRETEEIRSEQCLQENGLVYGIVDGGNVSVVRYLHTK